MKLVFPELRRRCRKRRVAFVEVDLRREVTGEQANRNAARRTGTNGSDRKRHG